MKTNNTCEFNYQQVVRSDTFRAFSLSSAIISIAVLAIGLCLWYLQRKSLRLINRGGLFVLLSSFGYLFVLLGGPISRYDSTYLQSNCVLQNFFQFAGVPTMFWPLIVRIVLWANKIKLNYAIAGIVGSTGLSRLRMDSPKLKSKIYLASNRYGLKLCAGVLGLYYAGIVSTLAFLVCPSCDNFRLFLALNFLSTALILLVISGHILFKNRKAPDNFYIRRETYVVMALSGILGLGGYLLGSFDFLGFRSQVPSEFDWAVFVDVGFFLSWMVVVPYQVFQSFMDGRRSRAGEHAKLSLDDILKTDRGRVIFELFLATDLSVENILFYNAVVAWKENYDPDSPETLKSARRIAKKYLSSKSYLEINVGQRMQQAAKRLITEAEENKTYILPLSCFDDLANEIYNLMSNNSLPRFRESDFYLLYFGEILPEMVPWLHFAGVSFYKVVRATELDSSLSLSAFRGRSRSSENPISTESMEPKRINV